MRVAVTQAHASAEAHRAERIAHLRVNLRPAVALLIEVHPALPRGTTQRVCCPVTVAM